ncbi:MAG: cysteine synthase A [Campylobacterales bacterium]|nr:cysteine synthase A [Campylobacterales bacterium]
MKIAKNISDLVGNTPIVQLNNINSNIFAKCEFMNPTSSVKDRIGMNMIKQSLAQGLIDLNTHIIEPTSGNTGVALASQCASLGIKLTLTMPESMSIERRKLMKIFGANIVLTPAALGMKGAIEKANELAASNVNSVILDQFSNKFNPQIHEQTTALEILEAMEGKIDIFVAAVGTGGSLSGTAKVLKEKLPNIKVIAVEPIHSAVLSGKNPGPHKIQGIGAGFIPKTLDTTIYDEIVTVANEEAIDTSRLLASKEGILVGISAGANIKASQIISDRNPGKNIVTILCDTGERYISTELFDLP